MSLDGLPPAHLRVLLDGLPIFERYGLLLAGGYAFRAHEIVHRPSQDLDFATRDATPLPEIAAHVQLAYKRAGYGVRLAEAASPRYARLVLRLPGSGEELEMDLLKEALEPRWLTVQISPSASVRAVMIRTSIWRQSRTISLGSASLLTKTSRNTDLMSEGSRTCATGSQAGMTTSPSASPQTLPTMKFRMTPD